MFVTMTLSMRGLARMITIDRAILFPLIFVFCVIGAYALSNRIYDVWVVLGFGIVGFGLERARVPLGPFVIGFVLEPLFESQLRAGLQMSDLGLIAILNRPIAMVFMLVALVMLIWPFLQARRLRSGDGDASLE
jgi:putative tricarboxylic transport membrane protein